MLFLFLFASGRGLHYLRAALPPNYAHYTNMQVCDSLKTSVSYIIICLFQCSVSFKHNYVYTLHVVVESQNYWHRSTLQIKLYITTCLFISIGLFWLCMLSSYITQSYISSYSSRPPTCTGKTASPSWGIAVIPHLPLRQSVTSSHLPAAVHTAYQSASTSVRDHLSLEPSHSFSLATGKAPDTVN